MGDTRHADVNWQLHMLANGNASWDVVHSALLMDLRDELKRLNALLHCGNFIGIPSTLTRIARAVEPRKRKRRASRARKGR